MGFRTLFSLVAAACGSISIEAARAYEAREREPQTTDDPVEPRFEDPPPQEPAANTDRNRDPEAETPDE